MSNEKSSILIVEDSSDLAAVFAMTIDREPDMMCLGKLACADTLLDAIADKKPDVTLLDLTMPGRDPLEAMAEAAIRFPSCRFVVVSGYDDPAVVDEAVSRGAWGFVSKHGDPQMILAAIRAVVAGEFYLQTPHR